MRTVFYFFMSVVFVLICTSRPMLAQWSTNPYINNAISTTAGKQDSAVTVSDREGGLIVSWQDDRDGDNIFDIYAQRINWAGAVQWTSDGVVICNSALNQYYPAITSDGAGGAIITWQDYRSTTSSDIYAQRINADGVAQWVSGGVAICIGATDQYYPRIVSDDSGGAIITWIDLRFGDNDIFAQRINASGVVQWTANGIAVCTSTGSQELQRITIDGSGGAIITWQDLRSGNRDIYAQRINASGAVQWTTDGNIIHVNFSGDQEYPDIVSDDGGGAIIAWEDNDGSGNLNIAVQRLSSDGSRIWSGGVLVSTAVDDQRYPKLVGDGLGGAIITWHDLRSGTNTDIYAQRVNAAGTVQWQSNGIEISAAANDQTNPTITTDGLGGAIITWEDSRNGNTDIYAQRVDNGGTTFWLYRGIPISLAAMTQISPSMVSDGAGGAVISWIDSRHGNSDIYAQKVERNGYLSDPAPSIENVKDIINDQGGKVSVLWRPSYLDEGSNTTVTSYYIFRGVSTSAATNVISIVTPNELMKKIDKHETIQNHFISLTKSSSNSEPIFWEFVDTVQAFQLSGYAYTMQTLSDSGPQGIPWTYAMVMARTSNDSVYWFSIPDSGYSVDNLPPVGALSLAAHSQGESSLLLSWNTNHADPDVEYYEVHRSETSNFHPGEETKIGQTTDTAFTDNASVSLFSYYRLVTVDKHGNRSKPSAQVSLLITDVNENDVELPQQYALGQNYPNPFNPLTTISYQLPIDKWVTLKVYNVLGEEVATLVDGLQVAGYNFVEWDASGMSSGVYVYRLNVRNPSTFSSVFSDVKRLLLVK